jgi:hypothetical protein
MTVMSGIGACRGRKLTMLWSEKSIGARLTVFGSGGPSALMSI